ncbi:MAG: hypothetical protein DRI57_25110 [Deltaproteobacteria bacterium]|nr:MAG: hypothetical protein DRI57_25110 [Deltaproteobacteria bacterium]
MTAWPKISLADAPDRNQYSDMTVGNFLAKTQRRRERKIFLSLSGSAPLRDLKHLPEIKNTRYLNT